LFFNKHKQQGREIGQSLLTMLSSVLIGPPCIKDDGRWDPPVEFFEDDYVMGFITGFSGTVIKVGLGGQSWSQNRTGECLVEIYKVLDRTGTLQRQLSALSRGLSFQSQLLQDGIEAGTLLAAASYNKLRSDFASPEFLEAQDMAKRLVSLGQYGSVREALPLSIAVGSIAKHLKENWHY